MDIKQLEITSIPEDGDATVCAYVPMQIASQMYEPNTALQRGTLFPDLDKPFLAYRKGGSQNARS